MQYGYLEWIMLVLPLKLRLIRNLRVRVLTQEVWIEKNGLRLLGLGKMNMQKIFIINGLNLVYL